MYLDQKIKESTLPEGLQYHLLHNRHARLFLKEGILEDIQDIYDEFYALYYFDETEFCAFIIVSLRKLEKYSYFYSYLKVYLSNNLDIIPKPKMPKGRRLALLGNKLKKLEEGEIMKRFSKLLQMIADYNKTRNRDHLYEAYRLAGELHVLFTIYPNNLYKKDFDYFYKTFPTLEH